MSTGRWKRTRQLQRQAFDVARKPRRRAPWSQAMIGT
jgi:hypothetical protein